MKSRTIFPLAATAFAICLPAPAISLKDAWVGETRFEYIQDGFDNIIQTDPLGSEDGSSIKATAIWGTDVAGNYRYDIDFVSSIGLSYDLTAGKDVTLGVPVELLIQIFDAGFQKLDHVWINGANLTEVELDEGGSIHGYPSLRLKAEPTSMALSANYQLPVTARFGITLQFDAAFDGYDNDFQTVTVTNAPREDLGEAMHPSTSMGLGVSFSFAGVPGEPATFRHYLRSGLVATYGGGATFEDVQGSVNGYTYPSGFQFKHRGDPVGLGVDYDLNIGGESYRAYDLSYDGWDGTKDVQIGANFAPRDQDSDGLPDDWEDSYGLDKTTPNPASSDVDGDSQVDWSEFLQGTDPTDPTSKLEITMAQYMMPSGNLDLSWTSQDDREYELHYYHSGTMKWELAPGVGLIDGQAGLTSYSLEDAKSKLGDSALLRVAVAVQF